MMVIFITYIYIYHGKNTFCPNTPELTILFKSSAISMKQAVKDLTPFVASQPFQIKE